MLEIARSRVKGVTFLKADMISLRLPQKFDVVLSLFSSIGYVKTGKRGKLRGDGMILRFPDRGESDSFWEWCRLPILTVYPLPS
jgi:hypothetical protein